MTQFSKSWFGKLGIFCDEFPGTVVGVHVHNKNTRCRIYKLDEADFQTADVWGRIRDMVKAEKYERLPGDMCTNCGVPLVTWARRWQGRRFCAYCGERFDAKNNK